MKRYKIAIDKSIWRYNTHETILDNDARVLMCVIHFHLSCVANQFAGHSLSRRYDRGQGRTAGLGLRQWETIPCKQRGVFCHRRSPVKEKGYFGVPWVFHTAWGRRFECWLIHGKSNVSTDCPTPMSIYHRKT